MSGGFPRGKTAIVGAAVYGINSRPGYTPEEMLAKAALMAIADAGLTMADIDGVFSMLPQEPFCAMTVPEYLGIKPKLVETSRTGGSAFELHAMWAAMALTRGSATRC